MADAWNAIQLLAQEALIACGAFDLALDVADQDAQGTLLGLAEGSYQKFSADPRLAAFLSHTAPKPDFFNTSSG